MTTFTITTRRGFSQNPEGNCLGWRQGDGPYQWLSYRQVQDRFLDLGAGIVKLGFKPVRTPRLLLYSCESVLERRQRLTTYFGRCGGSFG
jgi:hypothetical protein